MDEQSQDKRRHKSSGHSNKSRSRADTFSKTGSDISTESIKKNHEIEIQQISIPDQQTGNRTRENSQTEVQRIGMGSRKTTLYLSRAHSMAKPDYNRKSSTRKGLKPKQPDKDIDSMSVSSFGVEREFTFTGYDIMADDGLPEKPVMNDEETERRRLTNVYIEACKRNGIVPVTQLAKTIFKPNLCIRHHNVGPVGARAICVALVKNRFVRSINLEDCWIGVEGAMYLCDMLASNKLITEINISENRIGTGGVRAIADMMRDNQFIKKLDISGCDLADGDAKYVAAFMQSNIVLKDLRVSKNRFGEIGGCYIGQAIEKNETIEHLDLSWNHLRGKGAIVVARGIGNNVSIKSLDISWNGFAIDGTKAMSRALMENRTLRELDMSCNRLHTEAIGHLMTGVQKNDGLVKLRLAKNPIRTDVVEAMVKAIAKSDTATIEVLDLTEIAVKPEFADLLKEVQEKRPLTVIHGPYMYDSGYIEHVGIPIDGNMNPVSALYTFMHQMGYRVVDLLKRFDRDGNFCVSRSEFREGLISVNVPLTVAQLDDLLDRLDADGDGEVDYSTLEKLLSGSVVGVGISHMRGKVFAQGDCAQYSKRMSHSSPQVACSSEQLLRFIGELIDGEKKFRQKIYEKAKKAKKKGEPVVDLLTIRFSEPKYKPLDNSPSPNS